MRAKRLRSSSCLYSACYTEYAYRTQSLAGDERQDGRRDSDERRNGWELAKGHGSASYVR
jgi:hypothetical protein